MLKRFASNAGANVLSGVVAAGYQLGATAIAARIWRDSAFTTWALALSVTSIAPLFASSLSSVVTRRLVDARHSSNGTSEHAIAQAAQKIGHRLAMLAMALLLVAGLELQHRAALNATGSGTFAALLLLLLTSQIWFVLLQARFGMHYADEQNWPPAIYLALARGGALAGLAAAVQWASADMLVCAFAMAAGAWAGVAIARALVPSPRVVQTMATSTSTSDAVAAQYKANIAVLGGFAIWSLGSLVIQYGVPPIVSVIAGRSFNAFYLASTLNLIAIGAITAAMSALLAPMSRWHATNSSTPLRRMVHYGPLACALSCVAVLAIAWLGLDAALSALSTRAATADEIRPFLAILGFQTILRTAAMGASISLASAGSIRQMSAPIVLEIVVTIVLAPLMGWWASTRGILTALVIAALVSSNYTSRIGLTLDRTNMLQHTHCLAIFMLSQVLACAAWWCIVRNFL